MTSIGSDLEKVLVTEREQWRDGPPHELFKQLRERVPRALDFEDHGVPRREAGSGR